MSCGFGSIKIGGQFESACQTHDLCYDSATCSAFEKNRCDQALKSNMYKICDLKENAADREYCKVLAYSFYLTLGTKISQDHFEELKECTNLNM